MCRIAYFCLPLLKKYAVNTVSSLILPSAKEKVLNQHLKDYAIAPKIQPDRETGLLINLITDLEGKYKRKFAAIGSRTIRIISRKNAISQIKTSPQFSEISEV